MEFLAVVIVAAGVFLVGKVFVNKSRQKSERRQRNTWKRFAYEHNLKFTSNRFLDGTVDVSGFYRGYKIEFFVSRHQRKIEDNQTEAYTCTNAILINHKKIEEENFPLSGDKPNDQRFMEQQLIKILFPNGLICRSRKDFQITVDREKIYYRHEGFEVNKRFLFQLANMLCNLADNFPKVVSLGGEVVPVLQTIVDDKMHPFHSIALHLLPEIAFQSHSLRNTNPDLLCLRCLTRYELQKINLPQRFDTTYFACPTCHQNRDYFSGQVIVVLDTQMKEERVNTEDALKINWFEYRKIFDFDTIEIKQATDEDVERFAVQLGNDTYKPRSSRYKKMRCTISSTCELSENTIRILEHMVGNVETPQIS